MKQITAAARARRDEAHAMASMRWAKDKKRSRTAGLGDAVRSIGTHKVFTPPEVREHRLTVFKRRLRALWDKAISVQDPKDKSHLQALDRSRYFPHEGQRQRDRAARRAAQA